MIRRKLPVNDHGGKVWQSCARKRAYSKPEAEEQLTRKLLRTGNGGSIYPCNHCGCWHITKQHRVVHAEA